MSLDYAKYCLTEWGKRSREVPALRSAWRIWFFGGSGGKEAALPEYLQIVDAIVCRLEPQPRIVTIVNYCQTGSGRDKALRLDMPKTTYFRLLDQALWFVHTELDSGPCNFGTLQVSSRYRDKVVTTTR